MTRRSIDEQVEILKTTTERVGVSSEAASKFLQRAGIVTARNGAMHAKNQPHSPKSECAYHLKSSGKLVVKKNK